MNSSITYPKSTEIELVEHIFLEGGTIWPYAYPESELVT